MLSLLISLLIVLLVLAICWWIVSIVPIPPEFVWIVRVIFAIVCLIVVISLLFGGWSFPAVHPLIR